MRVLKPGGRLAGYLIHTPAGLTPDEMSAAAEMGPSEVLGAESLEALADPAGLDVVDQRDVTGELRRTCEALVRTRAHHEAALRRIEGDDVYEEEQEKRLAMIRGIDRRLLLRSLVVLRRPDRLRGARRRPRND